MKNASNVDVDLLRLRSICLFKMGDIENSVKHLAQAMRSDPDNTSTRTIYRQMKEVNEKKTSGDGSFKEKNYQKAIDNYSACIELSKASQAFSSKVHLNRATAYTKLENFPASVKDATVAIAYNPDYLKAYLRRAESYMSIGEPESIQKGIEDFEKAAEMETEEEGLKEIKTKIKKVCVA